MNRQETYIRYAVLLAIIVALCAYGLFFIYSAGYINENYPVRATWQRQSIFLCAGLVIATPLTWIICKTYLRKYFIYAGYIASIIGLLLVLVTGQKTGGATRWLVLGPVLLQPAEYAKVFTVLLAADILASQDKMVKRITNTFIILIPSFILILIEPSYGSAISLLCVIAVLILLQIPSKRLFQCIAIAMLLILATSATALLWLRTDTGHAQTERLLNVISQNNSILREYHIRRIKGYLDANGDWNERQSVLTVSSGGFTGKGYLQGTMKGLGYLPRTVAPTDFIFPVICEELGFFYGALPVLLLYAALLSILFYTAAVSDNARHSLTTSGIALLLFMHIAINIAMTMRLLPIIGLPLPLLSYGGSYAVAVFIALGAAMSSTHTSIQTASIKSIRIQLGKLISISVN